MSNRSLTERKLSLLCRRYVTPGTEEADIRFRNVALFLRAWKLMSGRHLERLVNKPRWFEFRVVGGFKAQVLPLMLDSMGIQVSKGAWMQILLEAAEDSIVLVTAQCEQIESSIVQLRREQKRRRREVVSPFWRYFAGFETDCWWACRVQDGTCDVPRRLCILFWLESTNLQLLYLHSLVISIVATCANS